MSLPSTIGPINPNGNTLCGIVNHLREQYSISDPVESRIIVPNASSTNQGNINTTLMHTNSVWNTKSDSPPYYQLQFPGRYLYPIGYSLQGVTQSNVKWCYSKRWRVEGFNPGEENDPSKWDLLARNSSSEQNFCLQQTGCQTLSISTYNMKKPKKGYQYIRWTSEELSCAAVTNRFTTSGVDVYGTLSTIQRRGDLRTCVRNTKIYSKNLLSYVFLVYS